VSGCLPGPAMLLARLDPAQDMGGQPGSVPKQLVTAGTTGQRWGHTASSRTEPNRLSRYGLARLLPTACGSNAWPCLHAGLALVSILGRKGLEPVGKSLLSQSRPMALLCCPGLPRAGAGCAPGRGLASPAASHAGPGWLVLGTGTRQRH